MKTILLVLGAFMAGAVLGAFYPQPCPDGTPRLQNQLASVVGAYVLDQGRWARQRDSLTTTITALRTDSARVRRLLGRLDQRVRVDTVLRTQTDTVERIALMDSAYVACRLVLGNCEDRAQAYAARIAIAESDAAQVRKRTRLVLSLAAIAVGTILIVR